MPPEEDVRLRIGIDIGGTFTDVVLVDESGRLWFVKVSSTPADPSEGFFAGIEKALAPVQTGAYRVEGIFHGSTVATNAVLERKGSRMGLVTTQGFRDILEIGRANIPGIFTNWMRWEKPDRLVPLERVREIPERLAADGSVVRPLDESAARDAIGELLNQDVEAIAISLIHSYANPCNEERLETLIHEQDAHLFVSRSSDVLPEYREYERTMTAVLNAYVMPAVDRYLHRIQAGVADREIAAEVNIMRSDAGVMSLESARARPVNTVLSGPAGGVSGARHVVAEAGYHSIVTMDMGGTSTDVCLITEGETRLSTDRSISHYPIGVPIVDITTIGAGGGSIAHVSPSGALRVGPESAGADPGPACYGRGGTQATVTDANLVLGRLPTGLAGGEIVLDVTRARRAIADHVADPLDLSVEEAAYGVLRIVNENMLGALRVVSVQRGIDPRELTLVAFGGAGPVHGAQLARLAGIGNVLVPQAPGVLSALGFLLADIKNVFTHTSVGVLANLEVGAYNRDIERLMVQAGRWLELEDVPPAEREIQVSLDLRYQGQAYELTVPVPPRLSERVLNEVTGAFHAEHRRRYGFDEPFAGIEVVTLRVTAIGHLPRVTMRREVDRGPDATAARIDERSAYFEGGYAMTAVYDRTLLRPGNRLFGPAIIVQPDCTTVVEPGQSLRVDDYANLIISTGG